LIPILNINVFLIKINVLQTGAVIGMGQNFLPAWTPIHKTTAGTGSQYGDGSCILGTNSCIDDSDLSDLPQARVL